MDEYYINKLLYLSDIICIKKRKEREIVTSCDKSAVGFVRAYRGQKGRN